MPYLTESLRIEILMMIGYGERCRTQAEVAQLFQQIHPDLPPITQGTISKIEARYRELGHVRDVPRQRQPRVGDDTRLNVLLAIEENPVTPAGQLARYNDISNTTVLKILKNANMHPFKIQMLQELTEDDPDRRIQFCEQMMNCIANNHLSLEWIVFSDESTFTLNGEVNRHNCRYWSAENPHWIRENHTQYPQKVNVWAGIFGDRILGPIFFNNNLNGATYLSFLQEDLVPSLAALHPNELDADLPDERIWYQQDGAPPHYLVTVRQYLDGIFPNRWIGRRGTIEWPARSPDLSPLDFFLWGYLKSKVYLTKPDNIEDLKQRIRNEVRQITPEVLQNVREGFYHRLAFCQERNGLQFEQFYH